MPPKPSIVWADAGWHPARTANREPVACMERSAMRDTDTTSRRLGGSGQPRQAAQDRHGSLQALLRPLPVVEEHDLHIGPDLGIRPLLMDEADEPLRIGEGIVAERDDRALGP